MRRSRRDPPRWFGPGLLAGMFAAAAALAGAGVLLHRPDDQAVAVAGRTYVVPPGELSAHTRDPHLFVRIRPVDRPFEIVHDARATGRRDRTGVPHIFSVNDHAGHDVTYGRDGRSLVLCRRATGPAGGCGTWVEHGGATWSVLFPEVHRDRADALAREATALLRRYDTRAGRWMR
ncbi:hypothetical protein E2493_02280 [Sphingomonas parva]|uniref:Uncharacterized protein n=1 Tax=Sphingomonas parva TaxID=2555898 RepID=A0A4Y8ZW05_9SPHN|nr:hypothetical protein [Sphingomonas parva]TFI60094.1 hypothetical protein E2493_02280 [Sphingomonas parva]